MASFLDQYNYLRPQAQTVARPPTSYQQFLSRAGIAGSAGNPLGTKAAASTGYSGGNTAAPTGNIAPSGPSEADLAYQAWRGAIDQANRIRSSGKATFDDLIKAVGGFRDRAKTQFTNAGQQITNTASELLGSNARSATEIAGQGRAQGRALGLGDSSKFNRQQKVNANLASTQGSTLATRGENERANQGVLDDNYAKADSEESTANKYLRDINDSASAVESSGLQNYGSALNNLINYQRQIQALNPLQASSAKNYDPNFTGVQNTLSSVLGSLAARPIAGGEMAGNLANPTDLASLLNKKPNPYGVYA